MDINCYRDQFIKDWLIATEIEYLCWDDESTWDKDIEPWVFLPALEIKFINDSKMYIYFYNDNIRSPKIYFKNDILRFEYIGDISIYEILTNIILNKRPKIYMYDELYKWDFE